MVGASEPRTSRRVVAHVLLLTAVMALAGLWLLPQALAAEAREIVGEALREMRSGRRR